MMQIEETEPKLSLTEVLESDAFRNNVEKHLTEVKNTRKASAGMHYKRDWYDRMNDMGYLSTYFFITNYKEIMLKRSQLSSEFRSVISYICSKSLYEVMEDINNQNQTK